MKTFLGIFVGLLGLLLTVLATTGIPLPTMTRIVECEGNPINVSASPTLRIQNYSLAVAARLSFDKTPILACATKAFAREAFHGDLRGHKITDIRFSAPNTAVVKGRVTYDINIMQRTQRFSVNARLQPHDQGMKVDYSGNMKGFPGGLERPFRRFLQSSIIIEKSKFVEPSDWFHVMEVRFIEGSAYEITTVVSINVWRYLFS